jgi:hypothetical protein
VCSSLHVIAFGEMAPEASQMPKCHGKHGNEIQLPLESGRTQCPKASKLDRSPGVVDLPDQTSNTNLHRIKLVENCQHDTKSESSRSGSQPKLSPLSGFLFGMTQDSDLFLVGHPS